MRQEVTHRWGVTASSLKRSSLSTGGWVGGKLTSPAPIYDITLYLIKGSESALNSSLISERYRKEIVRERAREILCRSVERGERGTCAEGAMLGQGHRASSTMSDPTAWGFLSLLPTAQAQPHWACWFKRGTFLATLDDSQRGQKAPSQLSADWHQIGHEFGQWIPKWLYFMCGFDRFPRDSVLCVVLYSQTAQKHPHQCKQLKFQWLQQEFHLCGINIQFTPVDWLSSRVIQRVGPPSSLPGKELCFSCIENENWQTVLKEQVREV